MFDTWSHAPDIGTSRGIDVGLSQTDGSFIGHSELVFGNTDTRGIAFTGGNDNLSYGVAYHEANPLGLETSLAELVFAYRLGQTELYGGLERQKVALLGSASYRLFLGAEYSADLWSAGLEVISTRAGGESSSIYTLFGTYELGDRLTVSGQLRDFSGVGATSILYGLGAEHAFGQGSFAQVGLVDDSASDASVTVLVGVRF